MKTTLLRYWQIHMANTLNARECKRQLFTVVWRNIMVLCFTFYLFSCNKNATCDGGLTHPKTEFSASLRIDGFYYKKGVKNIKPQFFYKNGIGLVELVGTDTSELVEFSTRISNGSYYTDNKDNKFNWGLIRLNNDIIEIEFFDKSSNLECFRPFINRGIILNDSTIAMTEYEFDNQINQYPDTNFYYFKEFPKPDSTNSFIE